MDATKQALLVELDVMRQRGSTVRYTPATSIEELERLLRIAKAEVGISDIFKRISTPKTLYWSRDLPYSQFQHMSPHIAALLWSIQQQKQQVCTELIWHILSFVEISRSGDDSDIIVNAHTPPMWGPSVWQLIHGHCIKNDN